MVFIFPVHYLWQVARIIITATNKKESTGILRAEHTNVLYFTDLQDLFSSITSVSRWIYPTSIPRLIDYHIQC
ncbi:hypothetical protein C0J52_09690 [Blattella germanica]|nr:hypothetical protein C0J52_09690 [Blattella germanica]